MNSISTYNTYLTTHQLSNYDTSSVGWIFSMYIFLTFLCGIFIGPVFDARGPRLLILVGSALMMASIMLMGVCTGMCVVLETGFFAEIVSFTYDASRSTGSSLSCLASLEASARPSLLRLPPQPSDTFSCSSVVTRQASRVQEALSEVLCSRSC